MIIKNLPAEVIFNTLKLEEHSIYLVKVKTTENNVEHEAVLFTGFKTGSYCEVYNNTYEQPIKLQKIYSLTIIKKITQWQKLNYLKMKKQYQKLKICLFKGIKSKI